MGIGWKQGSFRLWVVVSFLWVIGILIYMLHLGAQTRELLGPAPGEEQGDTWFWINLRWNWMILPGGPLLLLIGGAIIALFAKVVLWVVRGFALPGTPTAQPRHRPTK
jgi:hypothetical protein